jgi:hypothetical protein
MKLQLVPKNKYERKKKGRSKQRAERFVVSARRWPPWPARPATATHLCEICHREEMAIATLFNSPRPPFSDLFSPLPFHTSQPTCS